MLRGPQGTLFGRNAISGAVNMVSKQPSFEELSGYVDLTVGSYNRLDLRAGINLPLTETLAVTASMVSKERRGYMKALRDVFFAQRGLERSQVSLSGYWAQGRVEDVFQAEKKLPVGKI